MRISVGLGMSASGVVDASRSAGVRTAGTPGISGRFALGSLVQPTGWIPVTSRILAARLVALVGLLARVELPAVGPVLYAVSDVA